MNADRFRLVFNATRGLLMAVAETVAGRGRGATSAPRPRPAGTASVAVRSVCLAVWIALGQLAWAPAAAQIVADPGAPGHHRPTVLNAANGVPLVNVQTPSAAGVSRNIYRQFDVGRPGAVLNNSRVAVQTQQGGWVQGNPWLATGSARVILNEVRSNDPSLLRGYVEVAGQRAQVVIANPAGISCEGCGFVNASRATLTTGEPQFGDGGSLEAFLVRGGRVAVGGEGLDATGTDYTDLLARAVEVNAGIWARQLQVSAGAARIALDDQGQPQGATAISAGTGERPAFAIDVGRLGGMYAGKITLVGTEAGLGVRNAGSIGASAGELVLTADGRLENTGSLSASAALRIDSAAGVSNSGNVYAQGSTAISTRGDIANQGLIASAGDTTLLATGDTSRVANAAGAVLAAGLQADGSVGADGQLRATATSEFASQGTQLAGGTMHLSAGVLDLRGSQTEAAGVTLAARQGGIQLAGARIATAGTLSIDTPHALVTDDATLIAQALEVRAQAISKRGGEIVQLGTGPLGIALAGVLDNTGGRIATNAQDLTLAASVLRNTSGTIEHAGSGVLALEAGNIDNTGGQLLADQALTLHAREALVNVDGLIVARQAITLDAASVDNRGGTVASLAQSLDLSARAGAIGNEGGRLLAAGAVQLLSQGLSNAQGTVMGQGVAIDTHGRALDNTGGRLISKEQALSVDSGMLLNDGGLIQSAGSLDVDTQGQRLANTHSDEAGGIVAAGALTLATGDLDNTAGLIASGTQLVLRADTVTSREGGMLAATDRLQLAARSLDNRGGRVQALGDVDLRLAGTLDNRGGAAFAGGTLEVAAARIVNAGTATTDEGAGLGLGGRAVTLVTLDLDNREGTVAAAENLSITASAALDNSKGLLSAGRVLRVAGADAKSGLAVANTGGTLIAGEQLSITADRLGGDGSLLSLGDIDVRVTRDYTHTGELRANANALLETGGSVVNRAGMMAGGRLQLKAAALDNRAEGSLSAGEIKLEASADQALVNRGLIDGRVTFIDAPTLRNLGTGRIYGDQVAINAKTLVNQAEGGVAPVIAARERLDIGARTVDNGEHALVFSAGDTAIGGSLDADHRATGSADAVTNASATIESLGAMHLAARKLRNTNEHFSIAMVEQPVQQIVEYEGAGSPHRYLAGTPGVEVFNDESDHLRTPDAPPHGYESWTGYYYTRTSSEPQVVGSDPAQILSGGHMRLDADSVLNDKSRIVAGGLLHGTVGKLDNIDGEGVRVTTDTGVAISYWRNHRRGRDSTGTSEAPYAPPPLVETVTLLPTVYRQGEIPQGTGTAVAARSSGTVKQAAQGVQSPGVAGLPVLPVLEVPAAGPGRVVRAGGVNTTVPDNRLFSAKPHPGRHYIVETDPRFADYRQWLSSDYLLQAMGLDPAATHKRLGDGFYEQRILREQVLALTGQRFLEGYADDEAQYRALMASGVTFAKEHALRPGVALSAEQMAQLTSDMVWLVEQTVTLPDGSSTRALVPQLYVVVRAGDLGPSGALVAGKNVHLDVSGDLTNTGTIAGRQVVALSADNVHNLGGRIQGADVAVQATTDLNNIGGSISASSSLLAFAGRDLNVQSTVRAEANAQGSRVHIDRVAGLYVTGPGGLLQAAAGRDVNFVAAAVVNQSQAPGQSGGATVIVAGRDINLGTVTESSSQQITWNATNRRSEASSTEVGSLISTQGDLHLQAERDINARASSATSEQGALVALAGRDINLHAGESRVQVDESHQHTSRGLTSKKTITTHDTLDDSRALASTFSGATTFLRAEHDINIIGSNVVSDRGTLLSAGNDINVLAATETRSETHTRDVSKSGVFGTGGIGVTMGKQRQSTDTTTVTTTAAASLVGSTQGDVIVRPVNHYRQVGSHVVALEGNIDIEGKHVEIFEARETQRSETETRLKQSGVTVALSNPVVSAVQTGEQMRQSAGDTSDPRMRALAAATTGMAGKNAYDAVQKNPGAAGGIDLSVSVGSSRSGSKSTYTADTAYDSTLTAGGNVRVNATGAGQDSNALLRGVQIQAGGDVDLLADNKVRMLASRSTSEQHSTNSSTSASLGVSFGTNGLNFSASGSQGRGNADGSEVSWNNTTVHGGGTVTIRNGGDTEMIGAVISGHRVVTDIGGRLIMESPQDTSTYESRQRSAGGSVTVGSRPGGSLSVGGSQIDSTFASVGQQTAIHAGDGGFQVDNRGGTQLKGAVITSTQAAHEAGRNEFNSPFVILEDIANHAEYRASGYSVGLGMAANHQGTYVPSGDSVGFGSASGSASSVSRAGITGIAGDTGVRTGDAETGLARIFDADKVQRDVDAQVAITRAFTAEAPKAIASFADGQAERLRNDAKNESDPARMAALNAEADKWAEGGAYRVALHTAAGGLAGGVAGAVGAGVAAQAAPLLNALQANVEQAAREAGASQGVAQGAGSLVSAAAATALGAVAGGGSVAGAATALGVDANNRQLHPTEAKLIKDSARRYAQRRFGTSEPSADQVRAAEAELANTAQSILDNNVGVVVPHSAQAEAFLHELKIEYMQANGTLDLPGTAGQATGKQQLFYASAEQKNMPWLNNGWADPSVTGLIVRTPINPPKTGEPVPANRDRLTGLPLDEKGRYEVRVNLDGKDYSPRYFSCATSECVRTGGNLDMSDLQTQAYIRALDQKIISDIGKGATYGTVVTPVGAPGAVLTGVGIVAAGGEVVLHETPLDKAVEEGVKFLAEQGGVRAFVEVLGHSPSAAARVGALIDLAGGWEAFSRRFMTDVLGLKNESKK